MVAVVVRVKAPAPRLCGVFSVQEGRYKATWKREFKHPLREAGPPNHHDDKVDSDQKVVNTELSLCLPWGGVHGTGSRVSSQ